MASVLLVAEAGVNHDGSLERALALVDAAAEAGADAVKFQTFTAAALATSYAPKAEYQSERTGAGSQADMLARLELHREAHETLMARCRERGVRFLSSPFDVANVRLLVELGLDTLKVPSGQITDLPYLRAVGASGCRLLLSTGMADLGEVAAALEVLEAAGAKREDITLLHCTTAYPAPAGDLNLRAMLTLRERFGTGVGYSDHTEGIEVAVAAVALGASVIEKHFTLDRGASGPDHAASIEPDGFAALVRAVRMVEAALGDGVKRVAPAEAANVAAVRKSIVAARDIAAGETLTEGDLAVKRPGTGLSPMRWDDVVGTRARRDYAQDEAIEL